MNHSLCICFHLCIFFVLSSHSFTLGLCSTYHTLVSLGPSSFSTFLLTLGNLILRNTRPTVYNSHFGRTPQPSPGTSSIVSLSHLCNVFYPVGDQVFNSLFLFGSVKRFVFFFVCFFVLCYRTKSSSRRNITPKVRNLCVNLCDIRVPTTPTSNYPHLSRNHPVCFGPSTKNESLTSKRT